MKSPRNLVIIIALSASLLVVACGSLPQDAAPQTTSTPEPILPIEVPTETAQEEEGAEPVSLNGFLTPLLEALTQTPPDYAALKYTMGDRFWIAESHAGKNYPPDEAITQLMSYALPRNSEIIADLGIDPYDVVTFPMPRNSDEYIYTKGWINGKYLGILLINATPDGYIWYGVSLGPDKPDRAEPVRIEFEPGATSATEHGSLARNSIDEYLVYALEGQTMRVKITSPLDMVYLSISGISDGISLVRSAQEVTSWAGVLPLSQDYSIKAVAVEATPNYRVEVEILPLGEYGLDWMPLPDGICQDIRVMVGEELGEKYFIGLNLQEPFRDPLSDTSGTGCLFHTAGTGAEIASHNDLYNQLGVLLEGNGWTPDPAYDAGGPTGTMGAFRRGAALMLVKVEWEPSWDANCPPDQPISACALTPEQKIYTITISAAMLAE